MIVQKETLINGKTLVHTYSDQHKYIKQVETGYEYDEAYDVLPLRYTYVETDKDIQEVAEVEELN